MTKDTKKKKANIRSEVSLGGCAVLLMSPMILFALLSSIMGIFSGLSTIALGFQSTGIIMIAVFSVVTMIFLGVGWLYIRRLRELYRRGRYLNAEQRRVDQMIDTHSAEQRLMDKPKSTEVATSTGLSSQEQINPI